LKSADQVIEKFSLTPHPEGGWFRRTFESSSCFETINGIRPLGTAIYYLLKKDELSRLHYLDADETWYFHHGAPIYLHLFHEDDYSDLILGNPVDQPEANPQVTIPAGTIFGAIPDQKSNFLFSLVSCSVCPGFWAQGFAWSDVETLKLKFKKHTELLEKLSVSVDIGR